MKKEINTSGSILITQTPTLMRSLCLAGCILMAHESGVARAAGEFERAGYDAFLTFILALLVMVIPGKADKNEQG